MRSALARLVLKLSGVVPDVVGNKGRDEVVAVVVAAVPAQRQRLADGLAGRRDCFWMQLALQELVVQSLVDQDAGREGRALLACHQLAGVIFGPRGAVAAQVAGKSLLTPRAA